jgi:hypothetical protein
MNYIVFNRGLPSFLWSFVAGCCGRSAAAPCACIPYIAMIAHRVPKTGTQGAACTFYRGAAHSTLHKDENGCEGLGRRVGCGAFLFCRGAAGFLLVSHLAPSGHSIPKAFVCVAHKLGGYRPIGIEGMGVAENAGTASLDV